MEQKPEAENPPHPPTSPPPSWLRLWNIFGLQFSFPELDLRSIYHLLPITEGVNGKQHLILPVVTASTYTRSEYLVIPAGLPNTPAQVQVLVNDVLPDFLNMFVLVYLDDILIFSRSEQEHVQHVHSVLQGLLENQLLVKEYIQSAKPQARWALFFN